MARIGGKGGRVYLALTSGGTAEPLAYIKSWTMDFSTDKQDVTAMGDSNKTYVADLPDAKGTINGFYDDASAQMYTAATDGVARKFYLYPNQAATPGQYFFGTVLPDFSVTGGVGDSVNISGSWNAASTIAKVG